MVLSGFFLGSLTGFGLYSLCSHLYEDNNKNEKINSIDWYHKALLSKSNYDFDNMVLYFHISIEQGQNIIESQNELYNYNKCLESFYHFYRNKIKNSNFTSSQKINYDSFKISYLIIYFVENRYSNNNFYLNNNTFHS